MADRDLTNMAGTVEGAGGAVPESGELLVRSLREFCSLWARAVKTTCLYPATNPLPEEFRGRFFDALHLLLDGHGPFVIQATDAAFMFEGESVYDSAGSEENLAYLFFRDGIREIGFEPGVTREECDRFLQIMAEALATVDSAVDLANRLWEASLPHIKHYTVDRVVEGAYILAATDAEIAAPHEEFAKPTLAETAGQTRPESPYQGVQRERHLHIQDIFGDVTALSADEKVALATLCRPDTDDTAESLGLDVLIEIIRNNEGTRIFDDAVGVLERQYEQAVAAGRWNLARKLMIEVRGLMGDLQPRGVQRLNAALTRMAEKRHFDKLATYLNANPQAPLEPIRDLLSLFGPVAITPITGMLGTLENRPARMMVCDFLIAHGREAIDLIGGFIYDKRWYVSRNVAMILGEIGAERGVSFLKKSASHTDPRVRLETLRAAKRILGPEADRVLRGFLNDPDADLRKRALRALGRRPSADAIDDIKAQINPDELPDRDPAETRELLTTYARLGGKPAALHLINLSRRAPFFKRSRWQPVRLAAIRALGASSDPLALAELNALVKDHAADVADAARTALSLRQQLAAPEAADDEDEG
ncbi:MAG TPA: HEAT repeat domain-containing protein [bacterium]|nr:HEAT repeat domain-containing protein [bacterium]